MADRPRPRRRHRLPLAVLAIAAAAGCVSTSQPAGTPLASAAPLVAAPLATAAPVTTPATAARTAVRLNRPNCGLDAPVLCVTFDQPQGGGTRTGDLDPELWGVSRLGEANPGGANMSNNLAVTSMTGCGTTAWVAPPNDVRICNGQLYESVNDGAQVANLDMYPKQPFDFAGRTGKVTFDVSADSDGPHGAWPEFVITDKPVPGVRSAISGMVPSAAQHEVGFRLDGCYGHNPFTTNLTGVSLFFMSKNWAYSEPTLHTVGCITRGTPTSMNHIEVRVSTSRIEVWGTDAGDTALKFLAYADNLDLGFTKGLVWLDDVHYNARKAIEPCLCGTQWNHTFVWDNLGFDGPVTYRDLGTDVADNTIAGPPSYANDVTVDLGHHVGLGPVSLQVNGVHRDQTPTGAIVVLNSYSAAQVVPSVSVNGNPPIATAWPYDGQTFSWRSLVIPVPLGQVHDGNNTLTFTSTDGSTIVTNVSIILVAGRAVPNS